MGIININDDSFSGDGTLDISASIDRALEMIDEGADFIDIGAESARTNRDAIAVDEEIDRLLPFIKGWKTKNPSPILSINTWRPEVIAATLETGSVGLINDISGLPDPTNAELCADSDAALLIMHTVGQPKVPHLSQTYPDIWDAMTAFFEEKIELAKKAGLPENRIVLDPGIDFAKQRDDNLSIYRHIERLHSFGLPILLPISRKTVVGEVLDIQNPADRDAGTIACLSRGITAGAHIFRVHNVRAAADSARVLASVPCTVK